MRWPVSQGTYVDLAVQEGDIYQVTQGKDESVTAYAIRLEDVMAHIWTKLPNEIGDADTYQKFKDHLFNGIVRVYETPSYTCMKTKWQKYADLIIAAHKAETEDDECKTNVYTKSAVAETSEPDLAQHHASVAALKQERGPRSSKT